MVISKPQFKTRPAASLSVKHSEEPMHKALLCRRLAFSWCQSSAGSNQNRAESSHPQTHSLVSEHPEVPPEHGKMYKMRMVLSYGSSTPSSSNHRLPHFHLPPVLPGPLCLTHQRDPLHFILSTTHQLIINQTQIKPIFPSSSPKPLIAHYPALCFDTKVILLSGEFCCCFFFHKNC